MATYETYDQEFFELLCILIHISSGQPINEPEFFFSMIWRNTQGRRHLMVRHERFMIHNRVREAVAAAES